jgi:ABC-type bacteriocin/lantibiotic exporter with double-glycine peptidase domain
LAIIFSNGMDMTGWMLGLIVVGGLIGLLVYVMGSRDRYGEMTEEEFEEEAKQKSLLGAAIVGLEGTLRKREATIMMEAKSRVEKDATPSPGDPPEQQAGSSPRPK